MHNKNNNKTQTFIQGLRPFSSSIPKTLRKHLKKSGYNYSNIVDNWTKLMIDCFNPFPNNEDNNSWVMMDQIFFME